MWGLDASVHNHCTCFNLWRRLAQIFLLTWLRRPDCLSLLFGRPDPSLNSLRKMGGVHRGKGSSCGDGLGRLLIRLVVSFDNKRFELPRRLSGQGSQLGFWGTLQHGKFSQVEFIHHECPRLPCNPWLRASLLFQPRMSGLRQASLCTIPRALSLIVPVRLGCIRCNIGPV